MSKKDYVIPSNIRYMCDPCLKMSSKHAEKSSEIVCGDIEDSEISNDDEEQNNDDLILKCIHIISEMTKLVKADINGLRSSSTTKTFKEINDFDVVKWLSDRPPELLHFIFLSKLCNIDINTEYPKKLNIIAKLIELIYYCTNSSIVLPNHMFENLLCYSLINCKSYINFAASRNPGGAYTYISNWLKQQSKEAQPFPNGLLKAIFDNNQKVGKTYLISETNTVPTSVITSNLWLILDPDSKIQENPDYMPRKWKTINETIKEGLFKALTEPGKELRITRDLFIGKCIETVMKQYQQGLERDVTDSIIAQQTSVNSEKRCEECGCESDISYRVCRNCGGKVVKENFHSSILQNTVRIDPYDSFPNYPSSLPQLTIKAGEPDFINPNSYHNVIQVIQSIGFRAGVKRYGQGTREWLMIECDGLPYNLIRDIIDNVWRCAQCSKCFYGLLPFQEHKCHVLHNIEPTREFDWLVPINELLHVEMNVARSFIKLNWEVFTKCFGGILGFKSPRAQEYLKKGADHHKLWHFFEILYMSISLELSIQDPNYIYMQHSVFTYLHAMMMMRSGLSTTLGVLIFANFAVFAKLNRPKTKNCTSNI